MAGSGADAEQAQKRAAAAAAAYDYEGDARWSDYWSNVLVPPNLASRPDVIDHFKRKFYQRYIDRDLVVEPMSSAGSTQQSRPDVRSSSSPSNENLRARNSGETFEDMIASLTWPCSLPPGWSVEWDTSPATDDKSE